MANDKYGIPPGGNNGVYSVKKWKGIDYALPWKELMASIALGGWPPELWGMAGAVAAAESSRNPFIFNTFKKGHFGLFQISRSAWPDFFAESNQGGLAWCSPILNAGQGYKIYKQQGWGAWQAKTSGAYLAYYPQAMNAAADLEKVTRVHPGDEKGFWNSLISKKTIGYMMKAAGVSGADFADVANQGLGEAIAAGAGGTANATVDTATAVADSVDANFGWLRDFWVSITTPALWMRLAYGSTGVLLVAGGLFLIVRNRPAVQKTAAAVKTAATTVVPAGKVANAAKAATAAKTAAPKGGTK